MDILIWLVIGTCVTAIGLAVASLIIAIIAAAVHRQEISMWFYDACIICALIGFTPFVIFIISALMAA